MRFPMPCYTYTYAGGLPNFPIRFPLCCNENPGGGVGVHCPRSHTSPGKSSEERGAREERFCAVLVRWVCGGMGAGEEVVREDEGGRERIFFRDEEVARGEGRGISPIDLQRPKFGPRPALPILSHFSNLLVKFCTPGTPRNHVYRI